MFQIQTIPPPLVKRASAHLTCGIRPSHDTYSEEMVWCIYWCQGVGVRWQQEVKRRAVIVGFQPLSHFAHYWRACLKTTTAPCQKSNIGISRISTPLRWFLTHFSTNNGTGSKALSLFWWGTMLLLPHKIHPAIEAWMGNLAGFHQKTQFWNFFGRNFCWNSISLIGRKENDVIGICSCHSGIANSISNFLYNILSHVEKWQNSNFLFSLQRDFPKFSDQNLQNYNQKRNPASNWGWQKSEKNLNSQPSIKGQCCSPCQCQTSRPAYLWSHYH